MRPDRVEVAPATFDDDFGLTQRVEYFTIEQFISQATSLTPIWRMPSAMSCPCDIKTSAWRNFAMSSSGLSFVRVGPPLRGRTTYLPFRIATPVEKLLVVFVHMAALLYPMFKFLPQMYDWIMQLRIRRLYDEMRLIKSEMGDEGHRHDADTMVTKLDQLDDRANHLRLPRVYASMLYTLPMHINLVRSRLASSPDKNLQ